MIELRIMLILVMFAIASYTDLKERKSYDLVPIGFGGLGIVLYLFDWQEFSGFDYFALILNIIILIAIWKAKVAQGDLLLAIALSLIIPSIGPLPTGITIWMLGMLVGQFSENILCYRRNKQEMRNVCYVKNEQEMKRGKINLFKGIKSESKTLLIFKCHINRNHKFVTPIEKETVFGKTIKEIDISDNSIEMEAKQGQFVKPLMPGIPFMTGIFSLLMILNYFKIF